LSPETASGHGLFPEFQSQQKIIMLYKQQQLWFCWKIPAVHTQEEENSKELV